MYDLSVIVPARNEIFLDRTLQSLNENIEGNTEIIAILDGYTPNPPLTTDHPRITIIHNPVSVGQRAAQNQAARLSKAKYLMKVDAHCAFDKGFDVKMTKEMHDDWTLVPKMFNLHAFDWQCGKCGNRVYQGQYPKECAKCDNMEKFERIMVWQPRQNKESETYRFDTTMHFQYDGGRKYWGNNAKEDLIESMSIQGSCFMCTREKYWELGLADEAFGSWGQQGVEVACKTWL
jgi:glycosyltransferase involved in cell wall biosynthesis